MVAIGKFLVIEHLTDDEKTKGGLIIPDSLNKDIRYRKAKVISAGKDVNVVKEGDLIFYDRMAGHNLQLQEGEVLKVIEERNIVLLVD